jgi:hypothetical protein
MLRGVVWLLLLAVFCGLAWAGWNEYQKLEAYQVWAKQFDRSKYDIYAVLGQKDNDLTWGKPTRSGIINLQTVSLQQIQSIQIVVDDRGIDPNEISDDQPLPEPLGGKTGSVALEFLMADATRIRVPFTELPLAIQWGKYLQRACQQLLASPSD